MLCYTNIDSLVVRKSLVKYEIVLWNDYLFCYLHTELAAVSYTHLTLPTILLV